MVYKKYMEWKNKFNETLEKGKRFVGQDDESINTRFLTSKEKLEKKRMMLKNQLELEKLKSVVRKDENAIAKARSKNPRQSISTMDFGSSPIGGQSYFGSSYGMNKKKKYNNPMMGKGLL